GVLIKEFSELYESYREGRYSGLPELAVQYADFAVWQREWLQGESEDRQLGYWKQQLAGAPVLELPADRLRPALASHRGASVPYRITAELTDGVKGLSCGEGGGLFLYILTGLIIGLSRILLRE